MAHCQVCSVELPTFDPARRGSHLDTICNNVLNPRRVPRVGTWEARQWALRRIHDFTRGDRPGWGGYRTRQLRTLLRGWLS